MTDPQRKNEYRKGIDSSKNSERRARAVVSVRKKKRCEQLNRRRRLMPVEPDDDGEDTQFRTLSPEVFKLLDGPQAYYALQFITWSILVYYKNYFYSFSFFVGQRNFS